MTFAALRTGHRSNLFDPSPNTSELLLSNVPAEVVLSPFETISRALQAIGCQQLSTQIIDIRPWLPSDTRNAERPDTKRSIVFHMSAGILHDKIMRSAARLRDVVTASLLDLNKSKKFDRLFLRAIMPKNSYLLLAQARELAKSHNIPAPILIGIQIFMRLSAPLVAINSAFDLNEFINKSRARNTAASTGGQTNHVADVGAVLALATDVSAVRPDPVPASSHISISPLPHTVHIHSSPIVPSLSPKVVPHFVAAIVYPARLTTTHRSLSTSLIPSPTPTSADWFRGSFISCTCSRWTLRWSAARLAMRLCIAERTSQLALTGSFKQVYHSKQR